MKSILQFHFSKTVLGCYNEKSEEESSNFCTVAAFQKASKNKAIHLQHFKGIKQQQRLRLFWPEEWEEGKVKNINPHDPMDEDVDNCL